MRQPMAPSKCVSNAWMTDAAFVNIATTIVGGEALELTELRS